ncbi:MAG: hypothetical protein ACK5QT_09125, partial [Oligoflexia bacterium]
MKAFVLGWRRILRLTLPAALGILFVLLAVFTGSLPANARDLQGRLGVGYNAQFVNSVLGPSVPGVSIKYALSRDLAVSAIVSAKTASPTSSASGVKLFKNLFLETNLNFYMALG